MTGGVAGVDDAIESEDAGESRQPRTMTRPQAPTKAQMEEHLPLHLEYRDWCPDCVAGKGISTQHRSIGGDKTEVTWNMDYCFLGSKADTGLVEVEAEDPDAGKVAILVTYDDVKRAFWAMQVEAQGPREDVVKWCCDRLEDSGYGGTSVTVKTDQE